MKVMKTIEETDPFNSRTPVGHRVMERSVVRDDMLAVLVHVGIAMALMVVSFVAGAVYAGSQ